MMRRIMLMLALLLAAVGAQAQGLGQGPRIFSSGPSIPKLAAGWTFNAPAVLPQGAAAAPPLQFTYSGYNSIGVWQSGASLRFVSSSSDWYVFSSGELAVNTGATAKITLYDTAIERQSAIGVVRLKPSAGDADTKLQNAAKNGGYSEIGSSTEEVTLSTAGATTDSVANLLPANAEILAVTARTTTTITTAVNFTVGDATTAARFVGTNTGVAAGSTVVGLAHRQPDVAATAGPVQETAAKVRITCDTTPGAGKIRLTVYYRLYVAPTT